MANSPYAIATPAKPAEWFALRGQSLSHRIFSLGLPQRITLLALVFTFELIVISVWLDNDALAHRGQFLALLYQWGAWILRCIVGFAFVFVTFAWLRYKPVLQRLSTQVMAAPIGWRFLAAHACAMLAFLALSFFLYDGEVAGARATALATIWLLDGTLAIVLAALAFIPASVCRALFSSTDRLWLYALLAVILACVVGDASRAVWQSTNQVTFYLVHLFLRPFVSGIVADPQRSTLGTHSFSVEIAPECSGFEGAGLMLAFGIAWLAIFRRESRFPQALLLIPAGVVLVFVLNAVRIAALILIGNAGASRIALGGFHSQAGWISFNAVALAFSVAVRRLRWLSVTPAGDVPDSEPVSARANATVAYLLPFVAILAAGMFATSFSADFEWLYPLRFFAAVAVLWYYRRTYASLDWKVGWFGPAIGALVFVLWIGLARSRASAGPVPPAWAAAPVSQRTLWLVFRILAAVVTVPLAEELAFRGFLIRRFLSRDFDQIDPRRFTWLGLAISSVAFGLLHGEHWLAGTVAGLLYGAALLRQGRIGEAVSAHATTNALLAIYVLTFHQWGLW